MHFVLEYSDNIESETLDIDGLMQALHNGALETGLFPLKGIRSRAYACHHYRMADGNPEHVFIHLTALIGNGRSDAQKQAAAESLFAILSSHFDDCFKHRGTALSFELKELEPELKYNRNNIQDYLEGEQ